MLYNQIGSGVAFWSQIKHICTEIYNLSDKVRFKKKKAAKTASYQILSPKHLLHICKK